MDGQFLIRQIYDDEITYNLITAAVEILSEFNFFGHLPYFILIAARVRLAHISSYEILHSFLGLV